MGRGPAFSHHKNGLPSTIQACYRYRYRYR